MVFTPLSRSFYRPSSSVVAPRLLGHYLLRRIGNELCGGPIVEVEAYLENDPSAHGFIGPTPRNRVMFGEAGHAYIYFIYGNHYCMNAVCRVPGVSEAVLIRAIEPKFGIETMQAIRPAPLKNLTNGPGKLGQALQLDRSLDGADICDASSPLFIARNPRRSAFVQSQAPLVTTTRIGISKAVDWPMRFYLGGSSHVSKR